MEMVFGFFVGYIVFIVICGVVVFLHDILNEKKDDEDNNKRS